MTEEKNIRNEDKNSIEAGQDMSYILFLILILIFMGNGNTFNSYFNVLEKEINTITNLFKAVSATANSLQDAFTTPQKVMKEMDL